MKTPWKQLTKDLNPKAVETLYEWWSWLIDKTYKPVLFSIFGDVFLKKEKKIYWLNTGTGVLSLIAKNEKDFWHKLETKEGWDWLLVPVADKLFDLKIIPLKDQCYSYKILPLFKEGSYNADNFLIRSISAHLGITGDLHKQLSNIADGTRVRINVS